MGLLGHLLLLGHKPDPIHRTCGTTPVSTTIVEPFWFQATSIPPNADGRCSVVLRTRAVCRTGHRRGIRPLAGFGIVPGDCGAHWYFVVGVPAFDEAAIFLAEFVSVLKGDKISRFPCVLQQRKHLGLPAWPVFHDRGPGVRASSRN